MKDFTNNGLAWSDHLATPKPFLRVCAMHIYCTRPADACSSPIHSQRAAFIGFFNFSLGPTMACTWRAERTLVCKTRPHVIQHLEKGMYIQSRVGVLSRTYVAIILAGPSRGAWSALHWRVPQSCVLLHRYTRVIRDRGVQLDTFALVDVAYLAH